MYALEKMANTAQVEECTTTFLFITAATDRPSTAGSSQTVGWKITSGKGLVSQARPTSAREGRKGQVNCVYKPCPTGMQLAG